MKISTLVVVVLFGIANATSKKTRKRYDHSEATVNYENGGIAGQLSYEIGGEDGQDERFSTNVEERGNAYTSNSHIGLERVESNDAYGRRGELSSNEYDEQSGQDYHSKTDYKSNAHFHVNTGFRFSGLNSNNGYNVEKGVTPKEHTQIVFTNTDSEENLPGYNNGAELNANLGQQGEYKEYVYIPVEANDGHNQKDETGYSIGSGLRNIAQGSADEAHSAVASQHAAAQQAAFVAQNTLAQSAIQAATTANAALAGKEVLLRSLDKQTSDAHQAVENEIEQLKIAQKAVSAAKKAAQQAAHHVAILTAALNNAQRSEQYAEEAAKFSEAELASQTNMVGEAKGRLQDVDGKLNSARVDYEATKQAAGKASAAAEEALQNASVIEDQASHHLLQSAGEFQNSGSSRHVYSESQY